MMPQMQKTYTIKNDVNLKKNSLKLVADPASPSSYILEFDFDASTDCKITVYFAATELENEHAKSVAALPRCLLWLQSTSRCCACL